jgi:8-oxo-dGTP diphosphatase
MKIGVDYVGVTTSYFCHDGKGNFVMAKRSKEARDEHGLWDIGGGKLEHGTTTEDNVRKEIEEEYATNVLDLEFMGFRDAHREHHGKKTHWISLDFKVLVDPHKVKINEPHKFDDIAWFTLDTLPLDSEMHSMLPVFFEKYKDNLEV